MKTAGIALVLVCTSFLATAQPASSSTKTINAIIKEIKTFEEAEFPSDTLLTLHPLGSFTEADFLRRYQFYKTENGKLDKLKGRVPDLDGQINLDLLKYIVAEQMTSYEYKEYLNPILADEGFHTSIAGRSSERFSTKKDAEAYLAFLKDIPHYVDQNLDLMRTGLALGISQPKIILTGYEATYEQHIVDDPEKSVFWKPFIARPFAITETDWKTLTTAARTAINSDVIPAYKKIKTFFDIEYLPRTRTTIGASNFPNGKAYYEEKVKHYTTTNLSSEEVYQIGLKEVDRIQKEMLGVIKEVKFDGDLKAFINYLRTDPKFYTTSADQLLKEASFIAKKADGMLPSLFGKLPRQPYGVEAVPEYLAPTYTAGRYSGASIKSKSAAHYWVNTYNLPSRTLYTLESLTLHEAVPGHHLQGALTQELDSLPAFRRNLYINAFGEGWGLYAEYLGYEMGFYKDPYSRFGRLTYDMWRACRLVIDVAIHTKDWTRDQAVAYLSGHTALSLHEVNTEINRYISWPGQALAYKIGELKIREMRKTAEEQLGSKFNVRAFHDMVLSQGTVTLDILEKMTDHFIAAALKK
ncbi:MAG: DUF885 domain-containing protein [Chitinophagaceae bacterium]